MIQKFKFWFLALLGVVVACLSGNKVLTLIWLSAFTYADVENLKFWAYVYLFVFAISILFLVFIFKTRKLQ